MSERAPQGDEIADLYDRWSATYDSDENRTRDLAGRVLRTELAELAGGDVVELGCGTGRNTAWIAERARRVIAMDFSPAMLGKARERVSEIFQERVRLVKHDIRTPLPLEAESADLVVITLVLEHVDELGSVFAECARVLRPGAHLFVCELHPYRQWAGGQAQFIPPGEKESTRVPAFLHGMAEYVNQALEAGLRVDRMAEWRDERDEAEDALPRLLSLLYRREA